MDGTYALVATSRVGCLAGVCEISDGQLNGTDCEGWRFDGTAVLRDGMVHLDIIMEGATNCGRPNNTFPAPDSQRFRLKEHLSKQEWHGGSTIRFDQSETWLIVRRIGMKAHHHVEPAAIREFA
ncbi:hypothetical protein FZC33_06180 [Labrys sp. KNU-23]|uniref:hypothetical protein n=1 Tax=Labrys sp. KNU-23 TaxID=2789216 RepID=UPI0011EC4E7D|nr:hypothetical protein [Labrys sp. KNU-23]QEN85818.1 hypothetical protein FZC33_06180 [Labrys sp. KNU-23]